MPPPFKEEANLAYLQEAQAAWRDAIEGFSPADDLQLVEDAYAFTRNPEASRGRSEQQQQPPAASPSGHPHGPLPPVSTHFDPRSIAWSNLPVA